MEEWIDSKMVYEGKVVSLRVGHVLVGEQTVALREVVEHPGGVGIVPVLNGEVLLVRQFRVAIGRMIDEIPAGKLEPGEPADVCARRELEEEVGYRTRNLVAIGSVYSSVGYTSEEIRMFLAFDLEKVGQRLEIDERIEVLKLPIAEIEPRIDRNKFKDGKTVIGLLALLAYLRQHPEIKV